MDPIDSTSALSRHHDSVTSHLLLLSLALPRPITIVFPEFWALLYTKLRCTCARVCVCVCGGGGGGGVCVCVFTGQKKPLQSAVWWIPG